MKKLGLIFALKEELESMIDCFKESEKIEEINVFDLKIYKYKKTDVECYLIESGIGKVNAARCTQILIDTMKVDYVINVGVAGSISNNIKIGDIVLGDKLVQHDFDLTAFNRKKGEIPNVGKYINSDKMLLDIANNIEICTTKHIGVIASGDVFVSGFEKSKEIFNEFNALCVEMEGAAIAQVCYLCDIPFLVIRAISDSPNKENNNITYEEFLISSSKEVAKFIINLIEKIK